MWQVLFIWLSRADNLIIRRLARMLAAVLLVILVGCGSAKELPMQVGTTPGTGQTGSPQRSVVPEGSAPRAPSVDMRSGSDTGVSNLDNLTGNNMPTFDGYAQAGTSVQVFDGSTQLGTAAVDRQGYWSFGPDVGSALSDGTHSITAKAINQAGNASPLSPVLAVTVDTEPPADPAIGSVAENGPAAPGQVIVAGTAQPNVLVTVLEGRTPLGSIASGSTGAWSLTLTGVSTGDHTYRASATSVAGVASEGHNARLLAVGSALAGGTPSPTNATDPASSSARQIVAVAAGDIACGGAVISTTGGCQQVATSNLLTAINPDLVLPLGDNQYECGSLADFESNYGPTWGRLLARTRPAIGNHEYQIDSGPGQPCYGSPGGAPGYFGYFGDLATPRLPGCRVGCGGYYSYDVGTWHVVVLNSNCANVGGCGLGSPQETWLWSDLAAHNSKCTLAYWHYPRYTSGLSDTTFVNGLKAFWRDLYNAGVDLVLNGHDHDYERFDGLSADGNADPAHGIREFVVGTGGREHQPLVTPAAGSQVRNSETYGVLKLTLGPSSYSWEFVPIAGQTFTDSGSGTCHA